MLLDFDKLIKKYNLKIKGVLHIGAHYGQEHPLYKRNNIEHVAYFEPLSSNFATLKANIGEDALLFNCALGNEEKTVEMFVESVNSGQSSSILEPALHNFQYSHIVFDKKEEVSMKRLDDMGLDWQKYNFINIDVQGYELQVFKGAVKTLEGIDCIISEINQAELYKNCAHVTELIEFLGQYGFELVEESWDGVTWGDGLFIKNK